MKEYKISNGFNVMLDNARVGQIRETYCVYRWHKILLLPFGYAFVIPDWLGGKSKINKA